MISPGIAGAYRENADRPVAYIDETYQIQRAPYFYVTTAVVVQASQRDAVRSDIQAIVGGTFWHTTEPLRSETGRLQAKELLHYLGDPDGREVAVISHEAHIDLEADPMGEVGRAAALTALLAHVHTELGVNLFVLERRSPNRLATLDQRTKAEAMKANLIAPQSRMFQTSPADEPLLWLPDLVCGAYRQSITGRDGSFFEEIESICTKILGT